MRVVRLSPAAGGFVLDASCHFQSIEDEAVLEFVQCLLEVDSFFREFEEGAGGRLPVLLLPKAGGRSSIPISSESVRMTSLSMRFSNSRTLPGQVY